MLQKRIAAILALVFLTAVMGCGQTKEEDIYNSVVSSLAKEDSYAYVELQGLEHPVLLVTDGTWEADGKKEAMYCQVYYVSGGEAKLYGEILTQGTAYPVTYDQDGIYGAGHHYVIRYILDTEADELVEAEYANEIFDEDANVTYSYFNLEDGEAIVEDDTRLNEMFDKWGNTEAVDFQNP